MKEKKVGFGRRLPKEKKGKEVLIEKLKSGNGGITIFEWS